MYDDGWTQPGRLLRIGAGLAVAVTLSSTLAACGGDSDDDSGASVAAATTACNQAQIGKKIDQPLPSGVPLPTGASKPYDYFTQGATKVYEYAISGGPSNLQPDRDAYDTALTSMGYKITDTDEESGAEAESSFSGPHDGATKLDNLCQGEIIFTLTLTS